MDENPLAPSTQQKLTDQEVELRAAKARAEIAVIMPKVEHPPANEAEKKMPQPAPRRRRRGRKKNA